MNFQIKAKLQHYNVMGMTTWCSELLDGRSKSLCTLLRETQFKSLQIRRGYDRKLEQQIERVVFQVERPQPHQQDYMTVKTWFSVDNAICAHTRCVGIVDGNKMADYACDACHSIGDYAVAGTECFGTELAWEGTSFVETFKYIREILESE